VRLEARDQSGYGTRPVLRHSAHTPAPEQHGIEELEGRRGRRHTADESDQVQAAEGRQRRNPATAPAPPVAERRQGQAAEQPFLVQTYRLRRAQQQAAGVAVW
jgi:hypothetical protein